MLEIPSPLPNTRAFVMGECSIIIGRESRFGRPAWHLSIVHPSRYPTWDEIKRARYELLPHDITMAMLLPPPEEYVNVHQNCFHLWEIG